jgi:hypothetical protein
MCSEASCWFGLVEHAEIQMLSKSLWCSVDLVSALKLHSSKKNFREIFNSVKMVEERM